jgi:hypothetical protein
MSEESFRRPTDTVRSYELIWKGNVPTVRPSNWAPGYTPGHMASVDEAVKYGMHRLQQDLSDMREKWLNINTLAMSLAADDMEQADAVKAAAEPTTKKCDGSCGDDNPHDSHLTKAGRKRYIEPHTEQVDHGGFEDH